MVQLGYMMKTIIVIFVECIVLCDEFSDLSLRST